MEGLGSKEGKQMPLIHAEGEICSSSSLACAFGLCYFHPQPGCVFILTLCLEKDIFKGMKLPLTGEDFKKRNVGTLDITLTTKSV